MSLFGSGDVEMHPRSVEKALRQVPDIYHQMFPGLKTALSLVLCVSFLSHILQQIQSEEGFAEAKPD